MNRKVIVVGFLLILVAGLGYWWWKEKKETTTGKKEIKIGVVLPLTGPVAEPGNNVLKGIQVAVEIYNDTAKNSSINLIVEDSKSSPKDGVSAVKKLIEVDNVKIVIGDIMSSVFLAMAPIAENAKVLMISPGASNPAVKDAGDYIFRNYTSDNYDGTVMATYIYSTLVKRKAAVVYVNNDYGIGVKDAFISEFEKLGGSISAKESYTDGQTDLKTIATKLKQSKPDCIYIVGNPSENGYLVKELKNQNAQVQITGNLSFEDETFYKIAGQAYDSIIFSSPYFDLSKKGDYTTNLVNKFKSLYSKEPSVEASLGYDVAGILIKALGICNFNLNEIKNGMYKIQNYEGVTGKTSFDTNGDVKKSILIKAIRKDKKVVVLSNYFPE